MATLNVASYTSEKKQGIQTLTIITTANHNLSVEYIDIQITGADEPQYNGTFKFQIINETTLKSVMGIEIGIFQPLTTITGTIIANTIDYITLDPEVINSKSNLYKITQAGNYQILLNEVSIYRVVYENVANNIKVGERLNDDDRILYAKEKQYPIGIGRGAKWLIIEAKEVINPIEVRLISLN